jgi:hypothetical protein
LSQRNQGRVIDLDITDAGVKATQFDLADTHKDELYRVGYASTRDFFLSRTRVKIAQICQIGHN